MVGFSITAEQLAARVKEYVTSSAYTGWNNLGAAIGGLKGTDLRWANALELKNAVESAFIEKFGAKQSGKPAPKVGFTPTISIHSINPVRRNPRKKLPTLQRHLRSLPLLHRPPVQSSRRASWAISIKSAVTPRFIPICANSTSARQRALSTLVSLLSQTDSFT